MAMAVSDRAAARILVVDDDPKIVNLVRAYLLSAGFTVLSAGDGAQALEAVRRERPDLILLDLMLRRGGRPRGGAPAAREGSEIPILILSARGATSERVQGLAQGR